MNVDVGDASVTESNQYVVPAHLPVMRYCILWPFIQKADSFQCSWNPDTEASRPFTKQYIESLRVKIQLLESQMAQLRTDSLAPPTALPSRAPSPSLIPFHQETLDRPPNLSLLPSNSFHNIPRPLSDSTPDVRSLCSNRSSLITQANSYTSAGISTSYNII
ncbi:hypothetical protein RhiXN_09462 [Rhizoctonia solani]|uniref:Uncharacterized protein n=1 Tax=Rhizoctonia solani TaxID=456999 RepID=A0A8H8SXF1_9AGAM|nr:uncharacterized protein RhiXN_09462 [Rhizoctonia solani]QRW20487.1 hypothetical protein RhiXN_09462 [Rhizoctonia solani]